MANARIEAGNLTLVVEHRVFGDDGGPAVRVMGRSGGKPVQLLRFDCFEKNPHYHYDPDKWNRIWHLDKVVVPDPVAWTIDQLREHLIPMVEAAGYPDIAQKIDLQAVRAALDRVEQAMRTPST